MKILLQCTSSDENLSWCQYALVTFGDDVKKEVLVRRELHQMVKSRDKDLWNMDFWGIPGEFYDNLNVEDCLTDEQQAILESNGYVVLPDDFEVSDEASRTECDRMVVGDDGFWWKCVVKHTDVYIETTRLPYEIAL
jgi:hypothetical protein